MTSSKRRHFWIGLGAVSVLLVSAVGLAVLAWRYIAPLIPQANSTIITAVVTFIGSGLTLLFTRKWDRDREVQQEHRRQKTPLYEEFIAFLFRLFLSNKTGSPPLTEVEMMKSMVRFTQGMTVWASNDVIRKYGEFRQMSTSNSDPAKTAAAIEDILFTIRVDLGHPSGLRRGELLRLFINDLEKLIPGS